MRWEFDLTGHDLLLRLCKRLVLEGRSTCDKLKSKYADSPDVNRFSIGTLLDKLRCEVVNRAAYGLASIAATASGPAKVSDLDNSVAVKEILRLDVAVQDVLRVHIAQPSDHLLDHASRASLFDLAERLLL